MDDAVAIAGEGRARTAFGLGDLAAAGGLRVFCVGRARRKDQGHSCCSSHSLLVEATDSLI